MTIGSIRTNTIPSYTGLSSIMPSQTANDASPSGATSGAKLGSGVTFQSDFAAMLQAVQAGDMNAAQSALSTLQGDVQSAPTYSPTASYTASATSAASPQTDLDALFQAVQTGDVSSAQAALSKLQSDAQSGVDNGQQGTQQNGTQKAGGHHHHHHHGGGGLESAVSQAFQSLGSTDSTTSTDSLIDSLTGSSTNNSIIGSSN